MIRTIIFFLSLAAFCGRAEALRPLISEDTVFLGPDGRQAEVGFAHTESGGEIKIYSNDLTAEFSYGFMPDVDLLISAPWRGWTSRGLSQSGLGDVSLEAKFGAPENGGWTLAMKPGFSLPAGNETKGLGAGKKGVWVYGIAGRAAGPWQFYLNAGYLYNRNSLDEEKNILKGSAAAVLKVLPKARVSVELAAETNRDKSAFSHPLLSGFGFIWSPDPYLDLDAGVRYGLNSAAPDLGLLAGLTLRL